MERRIPASERTREASSDLIEGRLSSDLGRSELVELAALYQARGFLRTADGFLPKHCHKSMSRPPRGAE